MHCMSFLNMIENYIYKKFVQFVFMYIFVYSFNLVVVKLLCVDMFLVIDVPFFIYLFVTV